jgi:hypothetical protein
VSHDYSRYLALNAAENLSPHSDPERDEALVDAAERIVMRKLLQRVHGERQYWTWVAEEIG